MDDSLLWNAEPMTITEPAAAARSERPVIGAACRRFACRACRTKTGWRKNVPPARSTENEPPADAARLGDFYG